MRLVSAVAAVLRRLRVERHVVLLLFGLVAVTSLLASAAPRALARAADEGLRYEVGRATATRRNLEFTTVERIGEGSESPLGRVDGRGDELASRLPPSVAGLVETRHRVIETVRFGLSDPPNYTSFITLRHQDGVDDHIGYIDGRPPRSLEQSADRAVPARFEIALARAAAAELLAGVGDTLPAAIDPTDPMLRTIIPRPTTPVTFTVVGLFDLPDRDAPYWYDDAVLERAAVGGTEDAPIAYATAVFAPEAYGDLTRLGAPLRYRWRFLIDPARLDTALLDRLVPDLRRVASSFAQVRAGGSRVYRTALPELVDRFLEQRAATVSALAVAAIGPLAVAGGALGLVAYIVVRRRRPALALARGRGASAGQLLAAQLLEALVVTLPAALVGLLLATLLVPSRPDPVASAASLLVGVATTVLLVGATWVVAQRARRGLEREDPPIHRVGPRRFVVEATIVGVAVAAAWLLRERGLGAARGGSAGDFDPFLAATPILIGVATALVILRSYPVPVRLAAWLGARRRDLVPALGLRVLGRDPSAAYLPLLVVTSTVAIGVFSSILAVTIERGQVVASWQEVGADHAVEARAGTTLDPAVDPGRFEGVEAVAPAIITSTTRILGSDVLRASTTLLAVDPEQYAAVLAGAPLAPSVTAALSNDLADAPTGPGTGTELPIPVIVSRRLPNDWRPLAIGDVFAQGVERQAVRFRVAGFLDDLPGIGRDRPFLVAPLASVNAARQGPALRPTVLYVRGRAEVGPALRAAYEGMPVDVRSRETELGALRRSPLVAAVGQGFAIALAAAAVYAALAIVALITLDADRRARELAFLRTLGLTDRQAVGLTFVEHGPPAIVALIVGIALGLGIAWLLEPGLGLGAFIGPAAPVRLTVDWAAVATVALSVLFVVLAMVALSAWLGRRLDAARALRIGEA